MEQELPKIRSVHMTNLYLSVPENLAKFLSEFRQILKDNFKIITVEGDKGDETNKIPTKNVKKPTQLPMFKD